MTPNFSVNNNAHEIKPSDKVREAHLASIASYNAKVAFLQNMCLTDHSEKSNIAVFCVA